jgi:GNAT superfamily N-acetyltransferase/predicted enzyme related to lactoylglutathione lyase
VHLDLVTIVVDDYDPAIAFFVDRLGFELVEDSPATTNDGRPKRWVVVRPPAAQTGILLARADGDLQRSAIGQQHAGRVGFFLRVDDFDARHAQMLSNGIEFVTEPRDEPFGRFAVFVDIAGNRWDLLGPTSHSKPGSVQLTVRRIRADEGPALRAVRLAALRDSPSAFSSTHQAEVAQPAQHWAERARHGSAGDDSATYFATVDDRVVGLIGAYRPNRARAVVELVSMWTAPGARRTGAGRRLVDTVLEWARAGSADSVELWVTRGNHPAIELYRSAGFRETGDHQALPSDPCKDEVRMRRPLP